MEARTTFGYARPDDGAYIGYRIDGEGPVDFVIQPDWPGNIDLLWQDPSWLPMLRSLSSFARVIMHDHRGVGLSSRNVDIPNLESRVSDLLVVLIATATRRPVLVGGQASGAVNVLLAATRPRLPRAIVWIEPTARYSWAPDYPWGVPADELELDHASLELWGTENYSKAFVEEQAVVGNAQPADDLSFFAMQTRNACTPDVALRLDEMWAETDVRSVLEAVNVPTLLLVHEERKDAVERAEYIASRMPGAELRLMPGLNWTNEEAEAWVDAIREFIGEASRPVETDTVLSTALFTDIVGSTEQQASLGDRGWRDLVSKHHSIVRDALARYRGLEVNTAGDGFYASFDGPARAIRCALEISSRVRMLGLQIRAGAHTGECEIIDGEISGIAVTIGARISALAGASEILISQTVKDLVAGSGFAFEDAGEHELKGVPDRWHLYRVVDKHESA